ncbi:MAG: chemotaxis protein CheB [Deltaproteobacteria bacterium]|nr:chemotaxis protein CheB [Kofleriaceae bacterium]
MSESGRERSRDVVVMGASAGGLEVLTTILAGLPERFPATVTIVQHRPPDASNRLRDLLGRETKLPIEWAEQGGRHEPGRVYLAPPDLHLTFSDGHFNLTASARENHARPSINRLFRSAAAHYGSRTIGVLLTGLLDDGVAGLVAISRVGGQTVVQDPATATAPELPRNGITAVPTSRVTSPHAIAAVLVEAVTSPAPGNAVPERIRLESEIDLRTARPEELDRIGERTATTCSECGGPLWRVPDGGPLRYRCFLGHRCRRTTASPAPTPRSRLRCGTRYAR